MKVKREFHLSVGASSILMIFVVLCLTTFGILSFVTANADYKLSKKNADAVTAYYTADNKSNGMYQMIDSQLMLAQESAVYCEKSNDVSKIPNLKEYQSHKEFSTVTTLMKQTNQTARQKAAGSYRNFAYMLLSGSKDFSIQEPNKISEKTDMQVSYTVPVGNSQQLQVTVAINPYGSKTRCRIISHKLVSTLTWDENSHIEVWSGQ